MPNTNLESAPSPGSLVHPSYPTPQTNAGITVFGQTITLPQLVNLLLALITLVSLYFGVLRKMDNVEASQLRSTQEVKQTLSQITGELDRRASLYTELEKRMDSEERLSERLLALNDGAIEGVGRLERDLDLLQTYIRDQFTSLRRDQQP